MAEARPYTADEAAMWRRSAAFEGTLWELDLMVRRMSSEITLIVA